MKSQPTILDVELARLRGEGADAGRARVLDGRKYISIVGFTVMHLLAAFFAGATLPIGVGGIALSAAGIWFADAGDRRIIDAVSAANVNVVGLSTADVHARLTYSAEDGRLLVDSLRDGGKAVEDDLIAWLKSIDRSRRRSALLNVLSIVQATEASPRKSRIVESILALDELSISVISEAGSDPWSMIKLMAQIKPIERQSIIEADFPIRPVDSDRARIWSTINAPDFPALALVGPLEAAARAHRDRLAGAWEYLVKGQALSAHHPVACQPSACVWHWDPAMTCQAGYYPTASAPTCVRILPGMAMAK